LRFAKPDAPWARGLSARLLRKDFDTPPYRQKTAVERGTQVLGFVFRRREGAC
jgi:hypothetical protein